MMQLITPGVFKQRLDWTVQVSGNMEIDEFDVLRPVHLLHRPTGCVRHLPSTDPTMLRDIFPILLDGNPALKSNQIWESSRFASLIRMSPGISLVLESNMGINYAGIVYRERRDGTGPSRFAFSAYWRADNENLALPTFLNLHV